MMDLNMREGQWTIMKCPFDYQLTDVEYHKLESVLNCINNGGRKMYIIKYVVINRLNLR